MRALVMAVLNVTPDSFSDGGRYLDPRAAVARGLAMVEEGADIVDVGGESSRPGARPVPEQVEMDRVMPVIAALAGRVRVSVDTVKPAVARAGVAAGASLINDISASLAPVAAATGVGWVAMHMRGTPVTMQDQAHYDDVVGEVRSFLAAKAAWARGLGVAEVWIDPGIGFAKTAADNLTLLHHLDRLVDLGHPVLVGSSRKSFLGPLSSLPGQPPAPPQDRAEASLAAAVWAMERGAAMVRVHDVAPAVQAARLVAAVGTAAVPAGAVMAGPGR